MRSVNIAAIQIGPNKESKDENLKTSLKLLSEAVKEHPDFVVFPELFTTIYWCTGTSDKKYFEWAEPIPGPTTNALAKKAAKYGCYIVAPIFEKGRLEGEYYCSAAVIGPDGEIVEGTLPDRTKVNCHRKNYIGRTDFKNIALDEKFYFRHGSGYPIFETKKATVGILICYDKYYPESWRILALQGAEIIFVVEASVGYVGENFVCQARTHAQENQLFVVDVNRAGVELLEREVHFYGRSCIVGPIGNLIKEGPKWSGPAIISSVIDLEEIAEVRKGMPLYRDRRPSLYSIICQET